MTGSPLGTKPELPKVVEAPKVVEPVKKAVAKPKKIVVKKKARVKKEKHRVSLGNMLSPVFNVMSAGADAQKLVASEEPPKQAIRRNALEVKKEEEAELEKKTKQEEEWEIPAFLRLKK